MKILQMEDDYIDYKKFMETARLLNDEFFGLNKKPRKLSQE